MAKKHKHEDHVNHEAWAIPYGDLVTLLLALFVVMYAVSSVNEGKFRVAAASMKAAFNGTPTAMTPIQVGEQPVESTPPVSMDLMPPTAPAPGTGSNGADIQMMAKEIEKAMADLIDAHLVVVRQSSAGLEVEIQTDILFASGTADLSPTAVGILRRLAQIFSHFDNAIRVEGHTDAIPIHNAQFVSNWELSAARAASVVHLFVAQQILPQRLSLMGLGEYHPENSNDNESGRNRNRRVVLVIPADKNVLKGMADAQPGAQAAAQSAAVPVAAQKAAVQKTTSGTAATATATVVPVKVAAAPQIDNRKP